MKKLVSIILILIMTAAMTAPSFADGEDFVPEEEEGVFELAQAAASEADECGVEFEGFIFKLDPSEKIDAKEIDGIETVDQDEGLFTAESIEAIADSIPGDIIEYIEPDYIMELFTESEPNDFYYGSGQWNIPEMNVPSIWEEGMEGQDLDERLDMDHDGNRENDRIIVAVLDSGLNTNHEDIDTDRLIRPHNTIENSDDVTDNMGHGTFVTGLIMATKDNVVGIAGLGQSIYVMPVKVFDNNTSSTSDVVNALNYITELKRSFNDSNGKVGVNVSVINISFGGNGPSETLQNAVENAIASGIIVVCAAGNQGSADPIYPAMYAIGVGAYNKYGTVSSFSQRLSTANGDDYSNKVWISAPGEGVTSTYKNNSSYEYKSGTSYSCPEVAALAAICKGLDNTLDHYSFKNILKETAVYKDSGLGDINGQDIGFGWGTVDFAAAAANVIENRIPFKQGWIKEDGTWFYYVDNNKQTGWIKDNEKWYYLKDNGAMATGWVKVNSKWYYLKQSGAMATGWVKDNGKWYYLKQSGAMATGWIEDRDKWYYLKSNGAMAANEWVAGYWWLSGNGAWTYQYKGSWHKNSKGWWFGDTTGWYAKNSIVIIDGESYEFDANGYMK